MSEEVLYVRIPCRFYALAGSYLSSRETACLDNCARRFLDTTQFVVKYVVMSCCASRAASGPTVSLQPLRVCTFWLYADTSRINLSQLPAAFKQGYGRCYCRVSSFSALNDLFYYGLVVKRPQESTRQFQSVGSSAYNPAHGVRNE